MCQLTRLSTWTVAFTEICANKRNNLHPSLLTFLSCAAAVRLLVRAIHGFPKASTSSKSEVETRTAAINVTQTPNGPYDIEVIKKDALWLAELVDLDENEALRIVIIEWQNRPEFKLRNVYSDNERAALDQLSTVLGSTTAFPQRIDNATNGEPDLTAATKDRRSRLVRLFFAERRSLLATYEQLLGIFVLGKSRYLELNLNDEYRTIPSNKSDLLAVTREVISSTLEIDKPNDHILSCIEAMQHRLSGLETDRTKYQSEQYWPEVDYDWVNTNLHELISISDILHLRWRIQQQIAKSAIILPWFQMVSKFEFFASFPSQSDWQATLVASLQVSAASTSVALLDPLTSISFLLDSESELHVEQQNNEDVLYFFDRNNVIELQQAFVSLANACIAVASPAVFAWGLVLYTVRELGLVAKETRDNQVVQKAIDQGTAYDQQRSSKSSVGIAGPTQQSIYEDIAERAHEVTSDDPVECLMQSALRGCQVFDVLTTMSTSLSLAGHDYVAIWKNIALLDLVNASFDSIGYTSELLATILAILNEHVNADFSNHMTTSPEKKILVRLFLSNDFLMTKVFDAAATRFPYETVPFLRLCKALSSEDSLSDCGMPIVAERLIELRTFTHALPPHFIGYHTIREDEDANLVTLEQSLSICSVSESTMLLAGGDRDVNDSTPYLLPNGCIGQVISDSRPAVVMWRHNYPGLGMLGKYLQLFKDDGRVGVECVADTPEEVVVASVELLASLLKTASAENGRISLEEASNGLSRNSDIVTVLFEILERQLTNLRLGRAAEESLRICASCLELINGISHLLPKRVWPLLARSALLNSTNSSSLVGLVLAKDAKPGCSAFLLAFAQLFGTLVEEGMVRLLSPAKHATSKESEKSSTAPDGTPNHIISRLLVLFASITADIYEGLSTCSLKPGVCRSLIQTSITRSFRKLVTFGFSVEGASHLFRNLQSPTAPRLVLDLFRPSAAVDTNLRNVLQILIDGLEDLDALHREALFLEHVNNTDETLWFCLVLLRAARLEGRSDILERQLCYMLPTLARLYTVQTSYQLPCLKIMTEVITGGVEGQGYPPSSMLSLLGEQSCELLLDIFATFDSPVRKTEVSTAIWQMLTALLNARQQWLAVYILTGSSPQGRIKNVRDTRQSFASNARRKPFLQKALDELLRDDALQGPKAVAMLSFVCRAQENWSWASNGSQSHPDFFAAVISHVGKINLKKLSTLDRAYQYAIAALIAKLSTVYLHHARSRKEFSIIKKMMPAFRWYAANATTNTEYNASLHANLRKNIRARYSGCDLLDFKRTSLLSPAYGENFLYDTTWVSAMLSSDSAWTGTERNPGFAHEFQLANLNISLVDAQLSLLHGFKSTCIEHSAFFVRDREVQKLMAQIIHNCLANNTQPCPNERIFDSLLASRMQLCVSLLQSLVQVGTRGSEFTTLLTHAWEATQYRNNSYGVAIANNDLTYHRSCLASLLLCIQLHTDRRHSSDNQEQQQQQQQQHALSPGKASHTSTRSTVLEILSNVVAEGVGQISSTLFDQTQNRGARHSGQGIEAELDSESEMVGAADFLLLLSILHTALQLPMASQMQSQIASVFISSNIIDSTVRLYSWSHCLISSTNMDPIYSSHALSILVSLSTIPSVAEELGIENVLGRLATCRITAALQSIPDGVGPFELIRPILQENISRPRLYMVWCDGILPLCLNLLHSVGRPMAAEISAFLNQFPNQLARAIDAFATGPPSTSAPASSSFDKERRETGTGDASGAPVAAMKTKGAISLSLAREAARLSLVSHILTSYRLAGASAGVDSFDISPLAHFDESGNKKKLVEDLEEVLANDAAISRRSRIVATTERENGWASESALRGHGNGGNHKKGTDGAQQKNDIAGEHAGSVLEQKILDELHCALICLKALDEGPG